MTAKDALKEVVKRRITKTFVMALSEAEGQMYDESFDHFRKKVLDAGNDQIKLFTDDLEKFEVEWGKERLTIITPIGEQTKRRTHGEG